LSLEDLCELQSDQHQKLLQFRLGQNNQYHQLKNQLLNLASFHSQIFHQFPLFENALLLSRWLQNLNLVLDKINSQNVLLEQNQFLLRLVLIHLSPLLLSFFFSFLIEQYPIQQHIKLKKLKRKKEKNKF